MELFGISNDTLDANLSPSEHYGHEPYREPKTESYSSPLMSAPFSENLTPHYINMVFAYAIVSLILPGILLWGSVIYFLTAKIHEIEQAAKTPQTTKYTDITPQQQRIIFTRANIQAMKGMNDPTLNRYMKEFDILYKEYKANYTANIVEKILWSVGDISREKLLKTKGNNHHGYSRITGVTTNPTLANYEKLLRQYQRDSINARYKQLRNQNYKAR